MHAHAHRHSTVNEQIFREEMASLTHGIGGAAWLALECAARKLREAHRVLEWDGWEEGLVDDVLAEVDAEAIEGDDAANDDALFDEEVVTDENAINVPHLEHHHRNNSVASSLSDRHLSTLGDLCGGTGGELGRRLEETVKDLNFDGTARIRTGGPVEGEHIPDYSTLVSDFATGSTGTMKGFGFGFDEADGEADTKEGATESRDEEDVVRGYTLSRTQSFGPQPLLSTSFYPSHTYTSYMDPPPPSPPLRSPSLLPPILTRSSSVASAPPTGSTDSGHSTPGREMAYREVGRLAPLNGSMLKSHPVISSGSGSLASMTMGLEPRKVETKNRLAMFLAANGIAA
jgi:hypothetical protein